MEDFGKKILFWFLIVVILISCCVICSKAYHNHVSLVEINNSEIENPIRLTVAEQFFKFLSRARRVVTPKPAQKEQAGMAYYLFCVERAPSWGNYFWALSTFVFVFTEGTDGVHYETANGSPPTGTWYAITASPPAPTVTASGAGYLVSGAGTTAYNGQYNPNGATCNGEAVYELGFGPSPKWSWDDDYPLMHGLWAWGEQFPESPEVASSWAQWSDGDGGSPTIAGDANWGKIQLGQGEVAHSPVKDFGTIGMPYPFGTKTKIGLARYGDVPVGSMKVYYRESNTSFNQDDETPEWTELEVTYLEPVECPMTMRYRQIKLEGQ